MAELMILRCSILACFWIELGIDPRWTNQQHHVWKWRLAAARNTWIQQPFPWSWRWPNYLWFVGEIWVKFLLTSVGIYRWRIDISMGSLGWFLGHQASMVKTLSMVENISILKSHFGALKDHFLHYYGVFSLSSTPSSSSKLNSDPFRTWEWSLFELKFQVVTLWSCELAPFRAPTS